MKEHRFTTLLRTAVILGVLLCLTVAVGGAPARADSTGAGTVTASALNMRAEPSTASAVVTCLPRGTVVLVTGESGDWYQVYYNGHSGYMSKSYLTYSSSASVDLGTGTVKGMYVNVRSGPSTAYSSLRQVNTGATFPVTGVNGGFYQIRDNGATAYISSQYMTLSGTGGSAAPSATPAPQSQGTGVITGNYVRMRSGPSTAYSILGTYNSGTKMTITGQSGDWYAVSYNGRSGYVYKQYLSQSGTSVDVTAMSDTPAVTTAAVNLREGPSTAYTSKRVLSAGTYLTVTGQSGQWYRVNWNGVSGFMHSNYVSLNAGQSAGTSSTKGEKIVTEAKKYLGVPYVYAGTSPSGFDCSGFVYYVYKQCGYSITRTASAQNTNGTAVTRANLQPGDIIIFYNGAKTAIGHSGIYIGNNQFIHASSGGGKVMISGLSETYYNTRFYSARRVVK